MTTKASIPLLVVLSIGLTACEEGQFLTPPPENGEEVTVRPPAKARVEIQEIERRDIFAVTELALWDGRPSLGGIWIAHPDVTDPERVLIRNATSGQSIYGALFRRERNNPGPRLQLSSDAAAELGIIAGQPTELSVIVVRQEEVTIEPVPLPVDDIEAPADTTVESASAAEPIGDASVTEPATAPKRQGFFARLFGGGAAAATTTDDAQLTDDPSAAAPPDVETQTLDPITTGAAAAIATAEATSARPSAAARPVQRGARTAVATVVATPTPTPLTSAAVAPAPTPVPAALNSPFVQVGLFTVEANANAAATGLRQGGIVPTITPGNNANGPFWRVLVGPMTDASDQSEILAQVKSLGYSDAFLVSN